MTEAKWTLRLDPQLDRDLAAEAERRGLSKNQLVLAILKRALWTVEPEPGGDYVEVAMIPLAWSRTECDDCGLQLAEFAAIDHEYVIRNVYCAACMRMRSE